MPTKFQPLVEWLHWRTEDELIVPLDQLEEILGGALPSSAREYNAYWISLTTTGAMAGSGWRARLRKQQKGVEFRRVSPAPHRSTPIVPVNPVRTSDIVLVGCVKTKLAGRHPARQLYQSSLFAHRMRYAEATSRAWYILSAQYGLVFPADQIESYDYSLNDATADESRLWATTVLRQIDERIGSIADRHIEIHAGDQYRAPILMAGLRSRGAVVSVPLVGLRFGEQLAWYQGQGQQVMARAPSNVQAPSPPVAPHRATVATLTRTISADFTNGALDLSNRPGAPPPGWNSLPEFVAERLLRLKGATPRQIRLFITLLAAMDRARDADRLWAAGVKLFDEAPWTFEPRLCAEHTLSELRDVLATTGVSQRHGPDAAAWRLICEALMDSESPSAVRDVVESGTGDAKEILEAVRKLRPSGQPWFPFLGGPKISEMWVRMLAAPGQSALIERLDIIQVAVDVQVRKVTEYLCVTKTRGQDLEQVRATIQSAWRSAANDVMAPGALNGTMAGLDPALWFFAKWGCSHCERVKKRVEISSACNACQFSEDGGLNTP